jgi:hypothetical protein
VICDPKPGTGNRRGLVLLATCFAESRCFYLSCDLPVPTLSTVTAI